MGNEINDAVQLVRGLQFDQKTDEQLLSIVLLLRKWNDRESPLLVQSVENELNRRQKERHQADLIGQEQVRHKEKVKQIGEVKTAVVRLAGARWIDWAILIATVIAALAGIAGAIIGFLLLKH